MYYLQDLLQAALNGNGSPRMWKLFNTIVDENKGIQEVCRVPVETLKKAFEATYLALLSKVAELR